MLCSDGVSVSRVCESERDCQTVALTQTGRNMTEMSRFSGAFLREYTLVAKRVVMCGEDIEMWMK